LGALHDRREEGSTKEEGTTDNQVLSGMWNGKPHDGEILLKVPLLLVV